MSHTPAPASPEVGHGPARSTSEGHLTVGDVVALVEAAAPPGLAASWDSNGLICGDPAEPVRNILLAVDPVTAVVDEAIDAGVDMVITHHPLYLRGTDHIAATDPKGRTVHRLIRAGIALLNAHTSLDAAHGGVADALAERVGLVSTVPLEPDPASPELGIGRIGTLPQPVTLRRFAEDVAAALPDSAPGLRAPGGRPPLSPVRNPLGHRVGRPGAPGPQAHRGRPLPWSISGCPGLPHCHGPLGAAPADRNRPGMRGFAATTCTHLKEHTP